MTDSHTWQTSSHGTVLLLGVLLFSVYYETVLSAEFENIKMLIQFEPEWICIVHILICIVRLAKFVFPKYRLKWQIFACH